MQLQERDIVQQQQKAKLIKVYPGFGKNIIGNTNFVTERRAWSKLDECDPNKCRSLSTVERVERVSTHTHTYTHTHTHTIKNSPQKWATNL